MILRQGILLLLLLLLLKSTKSHPTQKRDTSSVSISKPSQNVINDGNPVNSEPASFSPHTVSPSYYHPKEVIGHSINVHKFHNWRTMSSMIVGSWNSASPEQKKIELGEVPPDTINVEALTVLDDSSMNSQADPNETSLTKSIKSSIETVPAIAKRAMDFKLPKWNFKGWRGWNGLKGVTPRHGGATQGIQKAQSMQKFEGSQMIQPGQISRNKMPNKGIEINNGRKVGSRLRKGVRVGRVRAAGRKGTRVGRKGTRVGQRNKDEAVKGNSPVALPAIKSDNSVVSNAPVKVASGKKNLKRPIFESDDFQTEGYARNRNSRSKDSFHNPPGFSEYSNFESETLSRTRNKGKKNRNSITPNFKTEDYYSSSDSGKSDSSSSFSKPKRAKSAPGRLRRKVKSSVTNSRPPEIKSVNSENKVPPVIISSSIDEKPTVADSGTKIHSIPASSSDGGKIQFMDQKNELPYRDTGMSDFEGEAMGNHDRASSPRNFRGPQIDDMDMHNYQMGGGGGGDNHGKSSGYVIGEAIANILPIAQTIGNVVTGQGNMGHGMGGYGGGGHGGGIDNMNDMGGYGGGGGMGGYGGGGGMGGYGGGGGMSGSGLGHTGGNFGANENGGGYVGSDPLDAHDLLDETRSKSVEESALKNIRKIKKDKNEPELATENHYEEDEKDNHDKLTEKTSEKSVQNSNSKETHNKNSKETYNKNSKETDNKNSKETYNKNSKETDNKNSKETLHKNSHNPSKNLQIT